MIFGILGSDGDGKKFPLKRIFWAETVLAEVQTGHLYSFSGLMEYGPFDFFLHLSFAVQVLSIWIF